MSGLAMPQIAAMANTPEFRTELTNLLVEMVTIDTTVQADVKRLAANEHAVFDLIESQLKPLNLPAATFERRAINPAIDQHPFFSQLYYTKSKAQPQGLSAAECYAGRANLLVMVDGEQRSKDGVNYAVNTHIDVIAPYIPPRVEGDVVYGRGACDDKGNAVAMIGALRLVAHYLKQTKQRLNRNLTFMFVIEEEMGGNGSLSAALDRDLRKRYDALTVMEICESKLYPGNRGCVWYKVEAKQAGVNLFEAAAYAIEEMEKEGRSIRSESRHDLFPHRPVQTCHGILGDCGQHPSRINGEVSFDIILPGGDSVAGEQLIRDILQFALDEYCGVYGDKTKINDKTTGKPKVDHHYDLTRGASGFHITVFGSTGHMGSIFENDGAITKMMTMVRSLIRSRATLQRVTGASQVSFRQSNWQDPAHLLMEGGQGFLPTHEMNDVQQRMRKAVWRGINSYLRQQDRPANAEQWVSVTYDKLHNAAFAGAPDSKDMQRAIACQKLAGIWNGQPVRGWDVSCDSRIFAKEYPDLNVITSGPGSLVYAHSDHEQISITEMVKFAEFLAYYILNQTGTVN